MSDLYQNVMAALKEVQDPELHKDLVSLGMIQDLTVDPKGVVSLRVVLTTPACPLKAKIEHDVKAALIKVPGVTGMNVKMDAKVKSAQAKAPIKGVSHVIAVSSGKGGVGKSTVAVNLAIALAETGAKVGLLDADFYGPSIPTMTGIYDMPEEQVGESGQPVLVPPIAFGLKVMSIGFLVDPSQPIIWRGPMVHKMIQEFTNNVAWGELDYLVVDMPPGTGDVQLSLAQLVPISGAVMVTTPQEVSIQDVSKAISMFEKVNVPVIGIVENMSYFRCDQCEKKHYLFGTGGGEKLSEQFSIPLLAQIPMQTSVREGGDHGRPVVAAEAGSEVGQIFKILAGTVAAKISCL